MRRVKRKKTGESKGLSGKERILSKVGKRKEGKIWIFSESEAIGLLAGQVIGLTLVELFFKKPTPVKVLATMGGVLVAGIMTGKPINKLRHKIRLKKSLNAVYGRPRLAKRVAETYLKIDYEDYPINPELKKTIAQKITELGNETRHIRAINEKKITKRKVNGAYKAIIKAIEVYKNK